MSEMTQAISKITIQDIVFQPNVENERIRDMYYRSEVPVMNYNDGSHRLWENVYYDFSTYFNSLSIEKWKTYTYASNFAIEIKAKGSFYIELMGHYIDSHNNIQKEWLGRYYFDLKKPETISLPFPAESNCSVVAFQISTLDETFIYEGRYTAQVSEENLKAPFISLVTTTFKKEAYVKKNLELLKKNIFEDDEYSRYFQWLIIDNGNTLDADKLSSSGIKIISNKNVGGAGGFTRGMIESLDSRKKVTHILLMDDDVEFVPLSFKRLLKLLMLVRPEYEDYFISGAMLENNEKNIQHEDVGVFRTDASHGPYKPRYDLNLWDSVIRNEEFIPEDLHQYAGWWYCCIPTTVADENNLPLPFFIRGDDVEYSIRNSAKFITMNGICIWHEGFAGKFSGSLELYQVHRNDLILTAIHSKLKDIQLIKRIKDLFWEEMYKFNYIGADLILDSVDDFLKGPEFIEKLDGEKCMKEKAAKDNKLVPITDEIRQYIDYDRLFEHEPFGGFEKFLYDHTCNGQKRFKKSKSSKVGVIPYGWGYYPAKQSFASVIYAVDITRDSYAVYKRSIKEFKRLEDRFNTLMKRYEDEYDALSKKYKAKEKTLESKKFWNSYLSKENPAKENLSKEKKKALV